MTRRLYTLLFPPESGSTESEHINLAVRLKTHFDRRYLDKFDSHQTREPAYGLAQRGAEHLIGHGYPVARTDWNAKNATIVPFTVAHDLITARFRVSLETALPLARPSVTMPLFQREKQALRAVWNHDGKPTSLSPDAFFIFHDHGRRAGQEQVPFFVESDRSTMTLARLFQKLEKYTWLYDDQACQAAFRVPIFTTLMVCKSAQRASNILGLVSAPDSPIPEDQRQFFLFTTEDAYLKHPTNILASIWRAADHLD